MNGFKDEPKNQKGTAHVTKIDGDGKVSSEVWMQADRHEVRPKDLGDNTLTCITWVAVSALSLQITRLMVSLAVLSGVPQLTAMLVAVLPYAIAGIGFLMMTSNPWRFYGFMSLFFVALLMVTL